MVGVRMSAMPTSFDKEVKTYENSKKLQIAAMEEAIATLDAPLKSTSKWLAIGSPPQRRSGMTPYDTGTMDPPSSPGRWRQSSCLPLFPSPKSSPRSVLEEPRLQEKEHKSILKHVSEQPSLVTLFQNSGLSKWVRRHRRVAFSTTEIRHYPMVMSDNPSCQVGPPVSIGWEYAPLPPVSAELYDEVRSTQRRAHLSQLLLSNDQRVEILKKAGVFFDEVTGVELEQESKEDMDDVMEEVIHHSGDDIHVLEESKWEDETMLRRDFRRQDAFK